MVLQFQFTKTAAKQARKLPPQTLRSPERWRMHLDQVGLEEGRLYPAYHDELVVGQSCKRSVRLSYHYRLFYTVTESGTLQLLTIEEITRHDYR